MRVRAAIAIAASLTASLPGCMTAFTMGRADDASAASSVALIAGDALIALGPSRLQGELDGNEGDYAWFWPWVGITALADITLALYMAGRQ